MHTFILSTISISGMYLKDMMHKWHVQNIGHTLSIMEKTWELSYAYQLKNE